MADGGLSIKLRCASWQQLSTIYKRDLVRNALFLKAAQLPPIGTTVRIDLSLPSGTVIALVGVVQTHVNDPQRGTGVELKLAPMPPGAVWMIESALSSENKRAAAATSGTSTIAALGQSGVSVNPAGLAISTGTTGQVPILGERSEVTSAEQELVKALESEAESLKKLNPFLVLGVGYEASDGDVRAAFGELTKRYHPDRFARYESPVLRELAAEIFILIRDAYRKLGDQAARTQLLQSLGKTGSGPRAMPKTAAPRNPRPTPRVALANATPPTATIPPPISASPLPANVPPAPPIPIPAAPPPHTAPTIHSRDATRGGVNPPAPPAERGRERPLPVNPLPPLPGRPPRVTHRAATSEPTHVRSSPQIEIIKRAATEPPVSPPPPVRRQPSHPPLAEGVDVSGIEELIDAGRLDEAFAACTLLGKQHPHDRNVRAGIELCEGLRALAARDRLEAAQRFEAALEIDPSNERAARELAEMRRQATNERKGLLSRLMGKKEP